MKSSLPPHLVQLARRHRVFVVAAALALFVLIVGAPVWAATLPAGMEQGTVPVPPSGGDGGSSGNSDDDDNNGGDNFFEATSTPGAPVTPETATPEATAEAAAQWFGVVTSPRLNVRSGPGASFATLGTVFQDQRLQIEARNGESTWWYSCCISGTVTSGWVSAAFIRPEFDAEQAAQIPVRSGVPAVAVTPVAPAAAGGGVLTATVASTNLNLRSAAGVEGAILGKLPLGTQVDVLSRNGTGEWWYVCCLPGSQSSGWASAQFLNAATSRERANALLPVFGETGRVVLPTPTPKAPKGEIAATAPATTTLEFAMSLEPAFPVPGAMLGLSFVVSNTGSVEATAVELRDELASMLELADGGVQSAGEVRAQGSAEGGSLFAIAWPQIAPGASVTATVSLKLASDAEPGSVIDNIAAVAASNARSTTTGVSIGLPPTTLPDFQ